MRNSVLYLRVFALILFIAVSAQPAVSQSVQAQDSVRVYPQKMPDKTTWEHVVSLPGTIVYLPVKLVFYSVQKSVAYFQDSESLAGLRRLLIPRVRVRGLLPAYSERSGVGLKYYFNDFLGKGSRVTINAKYGFIDNRQKHYLRFQDIALGKGIVSTLLFQYRYLTHESFFGIGPDTDQNAESTFSLEKTTAEASLAYRFNENASIRTYYQFEQNNVFAGYEEQVPVLTDVPADSLPGLQTRLKTGTAGFKFELDSRDVPGRARRGWQIEVTGSLANQFGGDRFRYWSFSADVKRVVHLFYSRTMVLRVMAQRVRPFSGKSVPFYQLSELGQRESIRGFTRGRFRDSDLLLASVEYRYPIWHYFDAVLFCDAGQVSPDITDSFSLNKFKFAFGGGIRVHSSTGLALKLEIGVSNERTRYYGVLNE